MTEEFKVSDATTSAGAMNKGQVDALPVVVTEQTVRDALAASTGVVYLGGQPVVPSRIVFQDSHIEELACSVPGSAPFEPATEVRVAPDDSALTAIDGTSGFFFKVSLVMSHGGAGAIWYEATIRGLANGGTYAFKPTIENVYDPDALGWTIAHDQGVTDRIAIMATMNADTGGAGVKGQVQNMAAA